MTQEELIKLEKFEAHFHLLMEKYMQLKGEKERLNTLVQQQQEEIASLKEKNNELNVQYNNLKLARIISVSGQDLEASKKRLAKLVRDVDKCIALLNT
ncbi:MAG: hypothetical protein MJZ83_09020 [Bacteroidaceae bacterium]|nr:hypothetical protein [Bacteroidaceae bacterium]